MSKDAFVQIGATRDRLDRYLFAAQRRAMPTVLVETPDYLEYRKLQSAPKFDQEVAVEHPDDAASVQAALDVKRLRPRLVLPGFECYVCSAFEIAQRLKLPPFANKDTTELPPLDKAAQRARLANKAPEVRQPRHIEMALNGKSCRAMPSDFPFPAVAKVVDGGGGLGVYRVESHYALCGVFEHLRTLRNYDGNPFEKVLVEQFISGTEYSVQGVTRGRIPEVLTWCEKIITTERDRISPTLIGFRERAHIARSGTVMPPELARVTAACVDCLACPDGPFHIDLLQSGGELYFIEMGYRLSGGGVVRLVECLTGLDWAAISFDWLISEKHHTSVSTPHSCAGHVLAISPADLRRSRTLEATGLAVEADEFVSALGTSTALPSSLQADIKRHTGFAGRIRILGESLDEVRTAIIACCPDLAAISEASQCAE